MKRIITNGITNLEPLPGSSKWYWGSDYASNDLYEAEELFRSGHPIDKTDLSWSTARRARSMSRYAQSRGSIWGGQCTMTGRSYC